MPLKRPVAAGLVCLVVLRSAVFVFWPAAHFDSDQAVTGLMAKHLSELRAFPVFWYGQTYMLGVEAWLAAPLMTLIGATVTALKLPLLAINVAVALLLFRGLTEDEGLDAARAAFATLFFVLAAPITTAHYLTANGGNVEPCLYVLLLWFLRRRPIWCGIVLGIGFLNREFTIYGAVALAVLGVRGVRGAAVHWAKVIGVAAAVWLVVLGLRHVSSAAGPGTTTADLASTLASNNLMQVAERLCLDPRGIAAGVGRIFTSHWPELFGLERQPLTDVGIESTGAQGAAWAPWLLVPLFAAPLFRLFLPGRASNVDSRTSSGGFCAYLMLTAALSVIGYLVGRCGVIDFSTMRYELLSPLGVSGMAGWYLRAERARIPRAIWTACAAAIFMLSATAHVGLLVEYVSHPPTPAKMALVRALDARGIRYAYSDYWTAYYVTFMTRERIIVAADAVVKVRTHNRLVDAHRNEAIRISRQPCPGGVQLTPAFWSCAP